jgi:hypothetical protein
MVDLRLASVWLLGGGGLVAGAVGLLVGYRSGRTPAAPATVAALALAGLGAWPATGAIGWLFLVTAGLLLLGQVARSGGLLGRALSIALTGARAPAWQCAVLAVLCPVAAAFVADACRPPPARQASGSVSKTDLWGNWLPPAEQLPAYTATTDRGRNIVLWQARLNVAPEPELESPQTSWLIAQGLTGRVIQSAPATRAYNCHGWVFTGGRYLLRDQEVEVVLQDNGYRPVATAAVGDLVVYRDQEGAVHHVAQVWGVKEDGQVVAESKWAWMGRFLHAPDRTVYGRQWAYYRSPRQGHLLQGLETRRGS